MRIGIDMDDTICCTTEVLQKYKFKYLKDNDITINELWNNKDDFLNKYLENIYRESDIKENVIYVLNKLKEEGHRLYIVTARKNGYVDDVVSITINYLNKYGIEVDGIFIDGKDKVEVCINNRIDIMIDDNKYNYDQLVRNNVKAILFDDKKRYLDIDNRIDNWSDIFKFI